MNRKRKSELHGLLLVDKPKGLTSHDVVVLARRVFRTREVGHSGTLDPMATGVLILAIGEATKLLYFISMENKEYQASIALGIETDTLDAEGSVVKTAKVIENLSKDQVDGVAKSFVGTYKQYPPKVSAVKQAGIPLYKRVRRGECIDVTSREITVYSIIINEVRKSEIDLYIKSGKGFYVRALARDLSYALGTVGHLCSLRRITNGGYSVDQAVNIERLLCAEKDKILLEQLKESIIPMADACKGMEQVILGEDGCKDAYHGRPILKSRIIEGRLPVDSKKLVSLLDSRHRLVAIAKYYTDQLRVVRGFRY